MDYRIRIVGGSGSGKTTMARWLGTQLGITDVIHLDDIFWKPGWKHISFDELNQEILSLIEDKNQWIVDGNYRKMGDDLTQLATHIIILYPPLYKQLWRLCWREIARALPMKFIQVTPPPLQVRNESNDEPVWKAIRILGIQATNYYKTIAAKWAIKAKTKFDHLKVFIYRDGKEERNRLIQKLKTDQIITQDDIK